MDVTDLMHLLSLFWAGVAALSTFTLATLMSNPIKGLIMATGLIGLEFLYLLLVTQGGFGID